MARKKPPFRCKDLSEDLLRLGVCYDFNPSYEVEGASVAALADLFAAIEAVSGDPVDGPSSTLRKEAIEAGEVDEVLRAAGLPGLRGSDPGLLLDVPLSVLVDAAAQDPKEAYLARVAACEALRGDPDAFEAARCKRQAHVMIPGGRDRFRGPSTVPLMTPESQKRLKDDLPYYDARTQSASLRRRMEETRAGRGSSKDQVRAYAGEIAAGLEAYRAEAEQGGFLPIPKDPAVLIAAGVPPQAARLLSRARGGKALGLQEVHLADALTRLFGGAELMTSRREAWLDVPKSFKLSKLRKPLRRPRKGEEDKTAGLRALLREAHRGGGRLAVVEVKVGSRSVSPSALGAVVDELSEAARPQPLTLSFQIPGREGQVESIKLQHSVLARREGGLFRPDYTTLRGFTLQELPLVLARKTLKPRKKRRGRQDTPFKTNPSRKSMARRRKSRRNPAPLYLSADRHLNEATSYYYPGTAWMYDELGEMGSRRSQPVNRRNPGLDLKQEGHTWNDFTAAYGINGKAGVQWKKYKKIHGIKTPPKAGAGKAFRGKGRPHARKRAAAIKAKGNPQAKAAMHLYHSGQAPTLKKAWKMVKSNPRVLWPRDDEYSSVHGQYGHGMSIPVNRRNPQAAEAMRLFHSGEAGSLQEGWDIVKDNPRGRRAPARRRKAAKRRAPVRRRRVAARRRRR